MSLTVDDPVVPAARRSGRIRRTVLFGFLALAGAAYFTYGPLPEPGEDAPPAPLERWYFKVSKTDQLRDPDVIFVPTPQAAVDRMLELAELKPGDILYDLGCGDGRIVVTAAKRYGVKAIGVDIDPARVVDSRRNVRTNGVGHLVKILKADIFSLDFSDAAVVTLYLLPELNVRLMPKLAQLKPGTRIISFEFDMVGAKPERIEEIPSTITYTNLVSTNQGYFRLPEQPPHRIYRWIVPWESEGQPAPQ